MQISSRFTIAVHIFACIEAFGKTHKLTSDFLAGSVNVNPVIIRKTMSQLQKAGLIKVARGTGGIKITRPLNEITLLDVFKAVDVLEHESLFHFHENPNPACPVGRNIHHILDGHLESAQSALEQDLAHTTLADIQQETQACLHRDAAQTAGQE
ncbi:Rrf2 family transcriptional regulator [Mitsuokella sp.]|uniref:Rrf2 family transcriptional regulator n=1 Tax=unclassified Mitsuokella TaxID=2637239 RepID=UPI003D7D6CE5